MTTKDNNTRNLFLIAIIIVAAVFRLLAVEYKQLSNFNPLGAIALFGGAYFTSKWKGYLTVLITLFATDIVVNYLYFSKVTFWYSGAEWVYMAFALMVFAGSLLEKVTVAGVLLSAIGAVLIHWLITDLPWSYGTLYPHTLAGYGEALVAAIPFERGMALGTLIFGSVLFGGFESAKTKYTFLQDKKQLAL